MESRPSWAILDPSARAWTADSSRPTNAPLKIFENKATSFSVVVATGSRVPLHLLYHVSRLCLLAVSCHFLNSDPWLCSNIAVCDMEQIHSPSLWCCSVQALSTGAPLSCILSNMTNVSCLIHCLIFSPLGVECSVLVGFKKKNAHATLC